MTTLLAIKDALPDFAKDIKLNLSSLLSGTDNAGLSSAQTAGTILACAYTVKNKDLIDASEQCAKDHLDETQINAVKASSTIMAMNNIYYRAVHLMSNQEFSKMPAKLRMNVIANPGIDKLDFELYSLGVSVINGCGACIDAHANGLQKQGATPEMIQQALRIAGIMHATGQALIIQSEQGI